MAKRAWVSVDLGSLELRDQVQKLADDNDRSLSAEIRIAVKERLARQKPKARRA